MIVLEAASATIDAVNKAYGKHKLCLGTALFLDQHSNTERAFSCGGRATCSRARQSVST
jgi:hypothetical protein